MIMITIAIEIVIIVIIIMIRIYSRYCHFLDAKLMFVGTEKST